MSRLWSISVQVAGVALPGTGGRQRAGRKQAVTVVTLMGSLFAGQPFTQQSE